MMKPTGQMAPPPAQPAASVGSQTRTPESSLIPVDCRQHRLTVLSPTRRLVSICRRKGVGNPDKFLELYETVNCSMDNDMGSAIGGSQAYFPVGNWLFG